MIENVAPRSGLFAADILPPCRSMMERQIERPSPSPSGVLVINGSKTDSSFSAAIPVPAVLNFDEHVRFINEFVRTSSPPRAVESGSAHGAERVEHQVQDDLLQLDPVTLDRATSDDRSRWTVTLCRFASPCTIRSTMRITSFTSTLVEPVPSRLQHGAQPAHDFAGALGDLADAGQRAAHLLEDRGSGASSKRAPT